MKYLVVLLAVLYAAIIVSMAQYKILQAEKDNEAALATAFDAGVVVGREEYRTRVENMMFTDLSNCMKQAFQRKE